MPINGRSLKFVTICVPLTTFLHVRWFPSSFRSWIFLTPTLQILLVVIWSVRHWLCKARFQISKHWTKHTNKWASWSWKPWYHGSSVTLTLPYQPLVTLYLPDCVVLWLWWAKRAHTLRCLTRRDRTWSKIYGGVRIAVKAKNNIAYMYEAQWIFVNSWKTTNQCAAYNQRSSTKKLGGWRRS